MAAYRIALEGVTNAIRHAHARTCHVRFTLEADSALAALVLTVTDDGTGLPATPRAGFGLTSMRERAEELGGTCDVVREAGGGTRVLASLPFVARREL